MKKRRPHPAGKAGQSYSHETEFNRTVNVIANGKQNTVTYPNGTIADYDYDALGQLVYLENRTAGGAIISSYVYIYDAVGNRLTMAACVDADCVATEYAYNINNQIISETTVGVLTQYFYDANGNTIEKDVDGVVTEYTYDDQNRLLSVKPAEASGGGGQATVEFTYDADGTRVSKTVDGTTTEYLLDKNQRYHQVLEERTDSGALIAEYVYGNQRISMTRGGEERFYHYDGHGSTSELTDGAGLVTDEYSYEAFGNQIASSGIGVNPFLYTGEAWDSETGMEYLRVRYYMPGIGRFLNMDTHPGNNQVPLTLNKYLYGNANPAMFADPSGMFGIVSVSISINIGSVLSSVTMANYSSGYVDLAGNPKSNLWSLGVNIVFVQTPPIKSPINGVRIDGDVTIIKYQSLDRNDAGRKIEKNNKNKFVPLGSVSADIDLYGPTIGSNIKLKFNPFSITTSDTYFFKTGRLVNFSDFDRLPIGWNIVQASAAVGSYSIMSDFILKSPIDQVIDMSGWDWGPIWGAGAVFTRGLLTTNTGVPIMP